MSVFISYVSEDLIAVKKLVHSLSKNGIEVWMDIHDIHPGTKWKSEIRKAIRAGNFFIACFSTAYDQRKRTYMNEELQLAIEELRMRSTDRTWFLPVLLSDCSIPDISINSFETINDLQWVNLYIDYEQGVSRLLNVISPLVNVELIHRLLSDIKSNDLYLSRLALRKLTLMAEWNHERLLTEIIYVMILKEISETIAKEIINTLCTNAELASKILSRLLTEELSLPKTRIVSALGRICTPHTIAEKYPEVVTKCKNELDQADIDHLFYAAQYWFVPKPTYDRLCLLYTNRKPMAKASSYREPPVSLDFNKIIHELEKCEKCGHVEMMRISNIENYDSGDWWFDLTYECAFCGSIMGKEIDGRAP